MDTIDKHKTDDSNHLDTLLIIDNEFQQALLKILNDPKSPEAVKIEQKLWSLFLKCYKSNSSASLINYVIGIYITLSEALFFAFSEKNNLLKFNRLSCPSQQTNQLLMYNIHIRLGDLYRYADSRVNAKYYYEQALQIDLRRGTAYNQLVLCIPLTKAYKCVYYSIRAFKTSIDSIKIAESNIKLAISRIDHPIFEQFRKSQNLKLQENSIKISYPENGAEWFYLSVISVYFNDFNLTLPLLLDYIVDLIDKNNFSSVNFDFALMALEVTLDWIMKDRVNLQDGFFHQTLKSLAAEFKVTLNNLDSSDKLSNVSRDIALKHNFMLKDFLPMKSIYESMHFYDEMQQYETQRDRKILIYRLIDKLENF